MCRCGKKSRRGKSLCKTCAAQRRQWAINRRAAQLLAGLCARGACRRPPESGYLECVECREYGRKRMNESRSRQRDRDGKVRDPRKGGRPIADKLQDFDAIL